MELATRQHGVVSRDQLRARGWSDRAVDRRVASQVLIRVHRGVFAVGHLRLSAKGRWMAAVLACGDGARLSHRDAAALWDLRRIPSGATHVTAPSLRRHRGVKCHRTRHPERLGDTVIDAIPVTTLERTLLDVAAEISPQRLRTLLEAAERLRILDGAAIAAAIESGNGHRGAALLRAAVALVTATPPELRSGLEVRFLELIRAAGLPEPLTNVVVEGIVVDAYWPQYRLVVEVDGWHWHRSRRSFEDDRRRANVLALADLTLLRFTDATVEDAPAQISRVIAAAEASGR